MRAVLPQSVEDVLVLRRGHPVTAFQNLILNSDFAQDFARLKIGRGFPQNFSCTLVFSMLMKLIYCPLFLLTKTVIYSIMRRL